MLKLAGLVCIVAGTTGLGLRVRGDLERGLRELRYMRFILERFISEIGYGKATLSECCRQVGLGAEEPYRAALCAIHRAMEERRGEGFSDAWKKEMETALCDLPLKRREKEIFLSVAGCVGLIDNRMQIRAIEQYRDMLDGAVKNREENLEKQGRLAMGFGVMSGLLLAVILL